LVIQYVFLRLQLLFVYEKNGGEHLSEFYYERHGIEVIMLRPADFTPFRDLLHYGERMLHGGVDRRDVLQAVVQAVTCPTSYGFYHIIRQDPFTEEDLKAYPESPIEVWDKAYLGAGELVRKHDFKLPNQIRVSDLIKERNELGYVSRYNFRYFS
jgi:hypothetical protein